MNLQLLTNTFDMHIQDIVNYEHCEFHCAYTAKPE